MGISWGYLLGINDIFTGKNDGIMRIFTGFNGDIMGNSDIFMEHVLFSTILVINCGDR